MKKLFGLGCWVVVLFLDQSTFVQEFNIENLANESDNYDSKGLKRNVFLGQALDFDYYALNHMTTGKEFISGIYFNTLKMWWGLEVEDL